MTRPGLGAILAGDRVVTPASVYDPLTLRIAADLGCEMAMLGGSVASYAILGEPDLILVSLGELADLVRRITRAAPVPLLVDADHGFGNALNARRTVEALDLAGAAGCSIEDTALPEPHGAPGGLIPVEEAAGKLAAAVEGKRTDGFVVAGRTAFEGDIDALRARVRAYSATGIDALFFTRMRDRAALEAARAETALPFILGGVAPAIDDPDWLAAQGVRIALRGHATFRESLEAAFAALQARHGGPPQPPDLLRHLTRADDRDADRARFLGKPAGE